MTICEIIAHGLLLELRPPPGTKLAVLITADRETNRPLVCECLCVPESVYACEVITDRLWSATITGKGVTVGWPATRKTYPLEDPGLLDFLQSSVDEAVALRRAAEADAYTG